MVAVDLRLLRAVSSVSAWVVARGTALAVDLGCGDRSMTIIGVHLNPALSLVGKKDFLASVRAAVGRVPGCAFLLGDWNFVVPGEGRGMIGGGERRADEQLGRHFDMFYEGFTEQH